MVNASLNWASVIGIILAVGGAMLYFMRSFKPILARDYDVFFAAIGLLCGGILFFQGWRLDPILQFGQFLLAGSTIFFAYESVRLRGVTTEQARRGSYFDDEETPDFSNSRSLRGDYQADRFNQVDFKRRRIGIPEEERSTGDLYRRRPSARPIIPERAVSRRENNKKALDINNDWGSALSSLSNQTSFGERRLHPQEIRRGNRRPRTPKNEFPQSKRLDMQSNYSHPRTGEHSNSENRLRKNQPIESNTSDHMYSREFPKIESRRKKQQIQEENENSKTESITRKPIRDNSGQFDDE